MATTVDELVVRIDADLSDLKRKLNQSKVLSNKATGSMTRGMNLYNGATAGVISSLGGLTTILGTLGAGIFGTKVIKANTEMEDLRMTLDSVFGSAERGDASFKFINEFAQRTPFDIQTLSKAFIQLRGAGINPTEKLLTTLGNSASATTNKLQTFESLVRITTRSVGGGLGLEELEQLVSAGIPVFQILQDELGITRAEVSEFGQSAEGAEQIMQALMRSFDTKFPNAMSDASKNLSVQMSNLGIAINNVFLQIGEAGLNKEIKKTIDAMTQATGNGRNLALVFGGMLAKALGFVRDNFRTIVKVALAYTGFRLAGLVITQGIAFIQLARSLRIASSAMMIMNVTTRALMSKKGLLGISLIVPTIVTFNNELRDAFNKFNDTLRDLIPNSEMMIKSFENMLGLNIGQDIENQSKSLAQLEATYSQGVVPSQTVYITNLSKTKEILESLKQPQADIVDNLKVLKLSLENATIAQKENNVAQAELIAQIPDLKKGIKELETQLKLLDPQTKMTLEGFQSLGQGVSDATADMVVEGKLNLDSLHNVFKSFQKKMLSTALELMVVNNIINSIFNLTGTSNALPTIPVGFSKASGGKMQKRPYLVGERGPELFVPDTSGTLLNNMNTRNIGGGSSTIVNQTINVGTGVAPTVRAEILNLLPTIKRDTITSLIEAKKRGGNVATAFA